MSNADQIHWEWMCAHSFPYRTFKVEDYFEKAYLPLETKVTKPGPKIFRTIIENADIEPRKTLLIDGSGMSCKTA